MRYQRGEARQWARETLRGVCNVIIASYTSDLSGLNEAGIRHDVRRDIELGFLGALLVSETALTLDEYVRFVEIAADEAQGRLVLIHHASFNTLSENVEAARRSAAAGAELALLSYPPSFYPRDEDDVFEHTAAFCSATDLAIILFPVPLWGFERFSPASLSMDLIERLADAHDNVAVVKAEGGMPSVAGFTHAWRRFSDRLVVTTPLEMDAVPLATLVPMQLIATSNTEYFGSAVPQSLALVCAGKIEEAMSLYWQMAPARAANGMVGVAGFNSVHRLVWKYQAWLNGFNGGPLRMPTARIVGSQMTALRRGLEASGLEVTDDPDELFFVGRHPA